MAIRDSGYALCKAAWGQPEFPVAEAKGPPDSPFKFYDQNYIDLPGKKHTFDILLRQEYKEARTFLERYDRFRTERRLERRVIVTGQPGIGKTAFLACLLIYRLTQRKPTAIQLVPGTFLLFAEGEVRKYQGSADTAQELSADVWALSDSDHRLKDPCDAFTSSDAMVVMAASPRADRWNEWKKQQKADLWVMGVWPKAELNCLFGHQYPALASEDGVKLSLKFGPSPRVLLVIIENSLLSSPATQNTMEHAESPYKRDVRAAAQRLAESSPSIIASYEALDFSKGEHSSKIFFCRPLLDERLETVVDCRLACLTIPTRFLADELSRALVSLSTAQQHNFFTAVKNRFSMRTAAGWLFESLMHARLSSPDVEVDCEKKNQNIIPMHSVNNFVVGKKLSDMTEPFYWRPSQPNYPGIDAILYDGAHVFCRQAMISSSHKQGRLSEGLRKAKSDVQPIVERADWNVVIVGSEARAARKARDTLPLLDAPFQDFPVSFCVLSFHAAQPPPQDVFDRIDASSVDRTDEDA